MMVRRGARNSGSVTAKWSRSRPSSTTEGGSRQSELSSTSSKSQPSADSNSRTSPIIYRTISHNSSPTSPKKTKTLKNGWKTRLTSKNAFGSSSDPKFTITNEDFPALSGGQSSRQSQENEINVSNSDKKEMTRPSSADSLVDTVSSQSTDDSGVSSSSRGNTPNREGEEMAEIKKSVAVPNTTKSSPINAESKTPGEVKELNKSNKTSFIKLTKNGSKAPERRGGVSKLPENESEINLCKENEDSVKSESSNVPHHIILGENGDMSNIPPSMLDDQFGMAALLPIINITNKKKSQKTNGNDQGDDVYSTDEAVELLTLGVDLNSLHVNASSNNQKRIWPTFAGSFGQEALLPPSIDAAVPNVYYTSPVFRGIYDLDERIPSKLDIHDLFFLFYNYPKEYWQISAAHELHCRGWQYHTKEKLWIRKKVVNYNDESLFSMLDQDTDIEKGLYDIYDKDAALIIARDLTFSRKDLETPKWDELPNSLERYVRSMTGSVIFGKVNENKQRQNVNMNAYKYRGSDMSKMHNRRLQSFADPSPDPSPLPADFSNPTIPDNLRRQMMALYIQMQQQQNHHQQQQQQQQQQHGTTRSNRINYNLPGKNTL